MSSLIRGCGCVLLMISAAMGEPSKEESQPVPIPLDQIWALEMPGTRDVTRLEKDRPPDYSYGPLIQDIRRALAESPKKDKRASACFAVCGIGLEALREAHAVLVKNKSPRQTFPANSSLSIVFYSHPAGSYVHLHEVEVQEHDIRIRYRFVPHETSEMTEHIALIPIAGMPEGKARVEIIQSPMEKSFLDSGFRPIPAAVAGRIVCQTCSFSMVSKSKH